MKNFADRLQNSIESSNSCLLAGFDPIIDCFPEAVLKQAGSKSEGTEDFIYNALLGFYESALEAIDKQVAAVKPNLAFFEQYGVAGMRAFASVVSLCKEKNLLVIADAKRADISTSAKAYSAAFLGETTCAGSKFKAFDCDAMTINPYLGPDSLQPFVEDCLTHNKGIFILVRTSNPEAAALQNNALPAEETVSTLVAKWVSKNGQKLVGNCGLSGLGAVVGATHPEEAKTLRQIMNNNFFLVPGVGAQGASFAQTLNAFTTKRQGAIINVSRALFSSFSSNTLSKAEIVQEIRARAQSFNNEIRSVLQAC